MFAFVFVNMNGFVLVGGLDSGAGGQYNDKLYYEGNLVKGLIVLKESCEISKLTVNTISYCVYLILEY